MDSSSEYPDNCDQSHSSWSQSDSEGHQSNNSAVSPSTERVLNNCLERVVT